MKKSIYLITLNLILTFSGFAQAQQAQRASPDPVKAAAGNPAPPVTLTAEQDHRRMMDLQHIDSLRPGADGNNPMSPVGTTLTDGEIAFRLHTPVPNWPVFLTFAGGYYNRPAPEGPK